MNKFNLNRSVPTHLAFVMILVVSFLVAVICLKTANKIITNARKSTEFNVNQRMKRLMLKHNQLRMIEKNGTQENE